MAIEKRTAKLWILMMVLLITVVQFSSYIALPDHTVSNPFSQEEPENEDKENNDLSYKLQSAVVTVLKVQVRSYLEWIPLAIPYTFEPTQHYRVKTVFPIPLQQHLEILFEQFRPINAP
jgi:hypothetical protein